MNKAKVMLKAEAGEGLTVAEIKVYQKTVKPQKHVYGKYGTLAKQYLEDKGIDWTIVNLPEYLHGVDITHLSLPPKYVIQEIRVNTSQVCKRDSTKVRVLRCR